MCVGSNPTPVTKRFEHDEAEPSADKFCHTGRSSQDDSGKQKKTKNRNVVCAWYPSNFKVPKKEDTQPRHYKHECTRGLERKSFEKDETNRLADYISELKILSNWKTTYHTEKSRCLPGTMAERSKAPDSRDSSVENSGTRVCAWVQILLLSQKVLNTIRQSLQLTNSLILERQFKMTVQNKRKQKKSQRRLWLITKLFETAQKKIPRRDMWNTNVRVGLNANLYKWMTQTV